MDYSLPELEVSMVVTTPYLTLPHITPNKRYVISRIELDVIWVKNDYDQEQPYRSIHFIEVDVYHALCLYTTFMRILNLANKPFKSLDK